MNKSYWLLKTEPQTYSFSNLLKDVKTNWNDVRNFQARNNLRKMALGDIALIYHSGDEKAVVGIAKVVKTAYPDHDRDGGDWSQVDIEYVKPLSRPISLGEIKMTQALGELPLIKQSRLSVMPITEAHYDLIVKLSAKN